MSYEQLTVVSLYQRIERYADKDSKQGQKHIIEIANKRGQAYCAEQNHQNGGEAANGGNNCSDDAGLE